MSGENKESILELLRYQYFNKEYPVGTIIQKTPWDKTYGTVELGGILVNPHNVFLHVKDINNEKGTKEEWFALSVKKIVR